MEHLCHDPPAEESVVGNGTLCHDAAEYRVVVIQDGKFPVFVGGDILAALGSLHGEQAAHVHADTAERFDAFVRRLGQLCLFD